MVVTSLDYHVADRGSSARSKTVVSTWCYHQKLGYACHFDPLTLNMYWYVKISKTLLLSEKSKLQDKYNINDLCEKRKLCMCVHVYMYVWMNAQKMTWEYSYQKKQVTEATFWSMCVI